MRSATPALPPDSLPNLGTAADAFALTQRRLKELDRLRGIGMVQAETLSVVTSNLSGSPEAQYRAMVGSKGTIQAFERINRAVRQIVVLEFEIRGLFKAPDRDGPKTPKLGMIRFDRENLLDDLYDYDDLDDLDDLFGSRKGVDHINDLNELRIRLDYSRDPVEQLVAEVRDMLGAIAPDDDPFAPPPSKPVRKPMSHAAARDEVAAETLRRFAAMKRPPGMIARPAAAAAKPAPVKAKPVLPRKGFRIPPTSPHNPNTPAAKRKRNRGPPGKRR